jgi:hypothetical protein
VAWEKDSGIGYFEGIFRGPESHDLEERNGKGIEKSF